MANLNWAFKMFVITSNPFITGFVRRGIGLGLMKSRMVSHYSIEGNNFKRFFTSKEAPTGVLAKPVSKAIEVATILGNFESDCIVSADLKHLRKDNESALDECEEDLSDITPYIKPAFTLAPLVNKSSTLQELVKLGVKLYKLEKIKGVSEYLLKLNFEENVKEHLRFLHDVGVPADEFGAYLTKNIFILKEDLEDMKIRINYLQSKKFTQDMIARIITKNPNWLSFSVVEIDKRLGFFQRSFILAGSEVRELATKRPTLITYDLSHIERSAFSVKEEMGFSPEEAKQLLLSQPKIFTISTARLKARFNYIHNEMKINHERILSQPYVLLFREFIIKQRHLFLQSLGRAQYDPKLPGYVSLENLGKGTDAQFCQDIAKTTVHSFNMFLKSL